MPARFGPVGFRINQGMGNLTFLAVLLMPDGSARAQHGTIDSHRSSTLAPGMNEFNKKAS